MQISDEAVEAAAKVVLQYIDLQLLENDRERKIPNEAAREILDAAAPYMLAPLVEALKVERQRSEFLLTIQRTPEESARKTETNPHRSRT